MNIVFPTSTAFSLECSIEYSQGGIISKQITKKPSGNITLFSFDEGQGLTEHTASFDAVIQILDGEAEIKIDGNPYILNKGECIVMPANHPHAVYAVKRFKMLLTMIK
ncbi:Cupin domain protein [uncultured Paludibacter sp.]|uniref:Cupin domain protein n=1 Tax=uncultured Paludibacter sp. TaxID=497635 RepID=A0A653AGA8_9BACT|nr:Cupin domain protein [uncultured Paludibacter sp.]